MPPKRTLLLVLVLFALTAPTWLYPYFPRFDSGAYLMGIESLTHGQMPRILSHPMQPPATYPPVTMALLAPAYALTGGSDTALRIGLSLMWLLAMLVFYRAWRDDERAGLLPWVLALAGTGSVWLYCGRIQSEIPYLLLTAAALACLERLKRDERFWGGWWGALSLIMVALVPLTRQIGLMLALGAAAYLAWDRLRWRRGLALAAAVLAAGVAPGLVLYSVTQPGQFSPQKSSVLRRDGWDPQKGHIGLLSGEMLGRLKMNVAGTMMLAPASLFPLDFVPASRGARAGLALLFFLMLVGYGLRWIRGPTAVEFYLVAYLGLLWLTPWVVETRFFTVLAPWLALYLLEALAWLAGGVGGGKNWRRWAVRLAAAGLIAVNLASLAGYDFVDRWSRRDNDEARMYQWGAKHMAEGEVLLTRDPFAFFVLHRRQAMSYSVSEQKYQPPYRLSAYLAGGGKVHALLFHQRDEQAAQACIVRYGLAVDEDLRTEQGWVFLRLAPQVGVRTGL